MRILPLLLLAPSVALAQPLMPGSTTSFLAGSRFPLQFQPSPSGGGGAATPMVKTNLLGWWDAHSLTDATTDNMENGGSPVPAWNSQVSTIVDKGSGGHDATIAGGTVNTITYTPVAYPNLDGHSGGAGCLGQWTRYQAWHWPAMAPVCSITVSPGQDFGTNADWSLLLVISRPNTRQRISSGTGNFVIGGTGLTGAITLASVGTTPILQMGGAGLGADSLTLFPTAVTPATLSSTMPRRSTTTILLVNQAGVGLTAIVDGVMVSGGPFTNSTLGTSNTGALTFGTETSGSNVSAQAWFHEAAVWSTHLSSGDQTTLDGYLAARYPIRGSRKGLVLVSEGQSNAEDLFGINTANATPTINAGVCYFLQQLACSLFNDDQGHDNTSFQIVGSTGIASRSTNLPGYIYDTDAPSGPWVNYATYPATGAQGAKVQTNFAAQSADDLADLHGGFMFWGENDAADWFLGDKVAYNGIVTRWFSLMRGFVGMSAAQLPIMFVAPPYGSATQGAQLVHQVDDDLHTASGNAFNFFHYNQTYDTVSNTDTQTPGQTWTIGGGSGPHRSNASLVQIAQRMSIPLAAMIIHNSSGGAESVTSLPINPTTGQEWTGQGPQIVCASRDGTDATLLHLQIQQDAGNDLILNGQAANAIGFTATNNSFSSTLLGYPYPFTGAHGSVTKIDSTHIDVKFTASLAAFTKLYYPLFSLETTANPGIGIGNAVTDNAGSLAPAGDNMAEIGFTASNYPLQAPPYGITIQASSTPCP